MNDESLCCSSVEILPVSVVKYLLKEMFEDRGFRRYLEAICRCQSHDDQEILSMVHFDTYIDMQERLTEGTLYCTRGINCIADVSPHCMNALITYGKQRAKTLLRDAMREIARRVQTVEFIDEFHSFGPHVYLTDDSALEPEDIGKIVELIHGCLNEREREIIQYCREGMDTTAISDITSLNAKTIRRYQNRAEKKGKEVLKRKWDELF